MHQWPAWVLPHLELVQFRKGRDNFVLGTELSLLFGSRRAYLMHSHGKLMLLLSWKAISLNIPPAAWYEKSLTFLFANSEEQ